MRLVVLIAAFVALTAVGLLDQHRTRAISARASSDLWWCAHEGIRCSGFDEASHHARWERRERAYEAGGSVLVAVLVVAGGRRVRLRLAG